MLFELNRSFDLGVKKFSEEEIIDFALRYDPLSFHLSVEAADKSLFGKLICSGPHPFNHFYKNHWIPRFGNTVMAGLGLDNWRFLKPIYVNQEVRCTVTIRNLLPHAEKGTVTVHWWFEFHNEKSELAQHLEVIVLHKAA